MSMVRCTTGRERVGYVDDRRCRLVETIRFRKISYADFVHMAFRAGKSPTLFAGRTKVPVKFRGAGLMEKISGKWIPFSGSETGTRWFVGIVRWEAA